MSLQRKKLRNYSTNNNYTINQFLMTFILFSLLSNKFSHVHHPHTHVRLHKIVKNGQLDLMCCPLSSHVIMLRYWYTTICRCMCQRLRQIALAWNETNTVCIFMLCRLLMLLYDNRTVKSHQTAEHVFSNKLVLSWRGCDADTWETSRKDLMRAFIHFFF